MKKRNLAILLISVLALNLMLLGCQRRGENSDASAAGSNAGTEGTILIGGAMSVTGIQAPIDAPALEGIQVAVDEINANGGINGRQVEFLNMDSKSDAAMAAEVGKQLIDKGAVAIVTSSDYDFGGPAARAAQEAGIVGISPTASSPLYGSAMLGDKQFTLSMWNTTMGAAPAEYAFKEKGFRSVYVITDDFIDYTKSLSKYFVESFEHLGGKVLSEDIFSQGKVDTAALIAHYKALPETPDFIFCSSYMPDLGTVIKEFRAAGIDIPIYGGDAYDDPALFELLGAGIKDILFSTHGYISETARQGFDSYNAKYKELFGNDVEAVWSLAGYDVMTVLAQTIKATGSTDGAMMAKYMEDTTFELLTGTLDWYDAAGGHEPNKTAALVELVGGQPNFICWYQPEYLPKP